MVDSNYSVIKKILVARYQDLDIPTFRFTQIKLSQICSDKSKFDELPFIQRSAKYKDREKQSKAGSSFSKQVSFDIAKLTPELSSLINKYSNCKVVIIITDGNDYSHLVYPVKLSQNRSLPGEARKINKTSIEIAGNSKYPSPFVSLDL